MVLYNNNYYYVYNYTEYNYKRYICARAYVYYYNLILRYSAITKMIKATLTH